MMLFGPIYIKILIVDTSVCAGAVEQKGDSNFRC